MNAKQLGCLALVLTLAAGLSATTALQIISVSSAPDAVVTPITSSLRGGKMIYIKAVGHDPMATGSTVLLVGNGNMYPCTIPADGVTDTFISCETTNTYVNSDISNLGISLISYNTFVTSSQGTVSYTVASTPYLRDVFPSAGFGGSTINFYGIHRISDLGDG
jgi:small ligand-binding sensory domain FIST